MGIISHFRLHCSTPNTAAMVWVLIKERKDGKEKNSVAERKVVVHHSNVLSASIVRS